MDKKNEEYMRIGELEKRSGVPRSTIHFYTREGLLPAPLKTGKTMAYYDQRHLDRLKDIEHLKEKSGMPLSFIMEQFKGIDKPGGKGLRKELLPKESTPSHSPKQQRRQEIARASIEIFSQRGYHGTKISDITQALGMSTGTFYVYFKDKQELFVEVVDEVVRAIVREAAFDIKGEANLWGRWVMRARAFFDNFDRYNEILHQLRAEMTHGDWPAGKIEEVFQQLTKPLKMEIRQAMDQGVIRTMDEELLAYSAIGIIEGLTLRTLFDDTYSFQDVITFLGDLIFKALEIDGDLRQG